MSLSSPDPEDWSPSDSPRPEEGRTGAARREEARREEARPEEARTEEARTGAVLSEEPPDEDDDPGESCWDSPGFLSLPIAEQARRLGCTVEDLGGSPVPESIPAGFTHRDGGDGRGFGAGGDLDVMLPGRELAGHVGRVRRDPAALSDDALIGALTANRRQMSWHAAVEYMFVAELDARRAQADGREGEHVDAELAAALTQTPRTSRTLLEYARQLHRLQPTLALLSAGIIDSRRAELIARLLEPLSDEHAAKVQDMILPRVFDMTSGQLSDALKTAIRKVDPEAARRRKEKALEDARVECWAEDAGTASLAGRDLPPAEVLAADKRIDAAARWLKAHGAEGTLDQLRAKVFLALLNGQPLHALLPDPAAAQTQDQGGASDPQAASCDGRPVSRGGRPAAAAAGRPVSSDGWPAGLTGSVHLTMPVSAWLGRSENPGEIAGFGAADADTCRDLSARLGTGSARWCITLIDHHGQPVGHGCARAGPPPRGDPDAWLATVKITPIETGSCSHRRQARGYRIPDSLRHVIKVRSRRCGFPGCRRPAIRCDDDHTIPYHLGGRSCECNLYPLCRRHHRCKQAPGWHLDQPEPGRLIWTSPSGRTYVTTAEPYSI
jgi:hypothetical protein